MPSATYKENSPSQQAKDLKELQREANKETITAKTTGQAFTILAQRLLDLGADLRIKGARSHADECEALSELCVEQLERMGLRDTRKEPEIEKPKQTVRQFRPVLDGGNVSSLKPMPQFRPVTKEHHKAQPEVK